MNEPIMYSTAHATLITDQDKAITGEEQMNKYFLKNYSNNDQNIVLQYILTDLSTLAKDEASSPVNRPNS